MQEVFERRNDLPTVSTRLGFVEENASMLCFRIYFCEKYITLSGVNTTNTNIDRLHESLTPLAPTPRESEGRTKVDKGVTVLCPFSAGLLSIVRACVHLRGRGAGGAVVVNVVKRCYFRQSSPFYHLLPTPKKNTGLKSEKRNVSPRRLTKKFIRRIWSMNLVHEFLPRLQP